MSNWHPIPLPRVINPTQVIRDNSSIDIQVVRIMSMIKLIFIILLGHCSRIQYVYLRSFYLILGHYSSK